MQVAITPDLVVWIAGYMEDCRILEPMSLRKDVSKRQELASQGHWEGAWACDEVRVEELSVEIRSEAKKAEGNCQLDSRNGAEGGAAAVEACGDGGGNGVLMEAAAVLVGVEPAVVAVETTRAVAVVAAVDGGLKSATDGTLIEHRLGAWGGKELSVDF